MLTLKKIFLTLILSNLFVVLIISYNYYSAQSGRLTTNLHVKETAYAFDDPLTAYQVLQQIDVFEPVDDKYYNNFPRVMNLFDKPWYGMKSDETYCSRHRAYFVDKPEFIFREKNFVLDYHPSSLVRGQAVKAVGTDIQPKIGAHMGEGIKNKFIYDFRPDVNIFFTNDGMHTHKHLGQQYACTTQIANHIPGRATINRKDYLAESVVEYAKKYESRPHCFNYDQFFPKTWVLRHEDQCKDFFEKNFNGPEYEKLKAERTIVYIRKIGAGTHQGQGVQPVNQTEEQILRDTYKNGELCGQVNKSTIVQTYIYNPLLLDGYKFDFRVYMVIASTNPMAVYYHDGFLRVSLHPYDVTSEDKSIHLTNTALSSNIFDIAKKEGTYKGLTEDELRKLQMWNFEKLQAWVVEKNMTTDQNWLDNYLRPSFKKAMIHLVRMTQGPFLIRSQVYELFGVDFMLDSNLNLWFIECNSGPVLAGSTEEKGIFVNKMLKDQFEIVFGYLKSRSKRIIQYVNRIMDEGEVERLPNGDVRINDLEEKRREFAELSKNYFEPEYVPSEGNGFHKITDDNLSGLARYSGLIEEDCI